MAYKNTYPAVAEAEIDEGPRTPEDVASAQYQYAQLWAALYADRRDTTAEVSLRNPANYQADVSIDALPDGLPERWQQVDAEADALVLASGTDTSGIFRLSGLEKLQRVVGTGEISSKYADQTADLIRASASLFAESSCHEPGNTSYYAEQTVRMRNLLPV